MSHFRFGRRTASVRIGNIRLGTHSSSVKFGKSTFCISHRPILQIGRKKKSSEEKKIEKSVGLKSSTFQEKQILFWHKICSS